MLRRAALRGPASVCSSSNGSYSPHRGTDTSLEESPPIIGKILRRRSFLNKEPKGQFHLLSQCLSTHCQKEKDRERIQSKQHTSQEGVTSGERRRGPSLSPSKIITHFYNSRKYYSISSCFKAQLHKFTQIQFMNISKI